MSADVQHVNRCFSRLDSRISVRVSKDAQEAPALQHLRVTKGMTHPKRSGCVFLQLADVKLVYWCFSGCWFRILVRVTNDALYGFLGEPAHKIRSLTQGLCLQMYNLLTDVFSGLGSMAGFRSAWKRGLPEWWTYLSRSVYSDHCLIRILFCSWLLRIVQSSEWCRSFCIVTTPCFLGVLFQVCLLQMAEWLEREGRGKVFQMTWKNGIVPRLLFLANKRHTRTHHHVIRSVRSVGCGVRDVFSTTITRTMTTTCLHKAARCQRRKTKHSELPEGWSKTHGNSIGQENFTSLPLIMSEK